MSYIGLKWIETSRFSNNGLVDLILFVTSNTIFPVALRTPVFSGYKPLEEKKSLK